MKNGIRIAIQSSTYYPRFIQPQSRFNSEAGFFFTRRSFSEGGFASNNVCHELHGLAQMKTEEVF